MLSTCIDCGSKAQFVFDRNTGESIVQCILCKKQTAPSETMRIALLEWNELNSSTKEKT